MLSFLPPVLLGIVTTSLLISNLLLWATPVYTVIIAKIVLPLPIWRRFCTDTLEWMVELWSKINECVIWLTQKITWDISGIDNLERKTWYLVNCNHQSAVDIFVIQKIFNRRIPFPKYFLKKELMWMPLLGPIWWALEYPFMKRYSKEYLKKHPDLKDQDLVTARKKCERYRMRHVAILNFLEGTRFSRQKHEEQSSPYRHLLRPKAGGIALALSSLREQLKSFLDVTIVYPEQPVSLWRFLSGRISQIIVRVEHLPIFPILKEGNYLTDPDFRAYFQNWVQQMWERKDDLIESLMNDLQPDQISTALTENIANTFQATSDGKSAQNQNVQYPSDKPAVERNDSAPGR